MGLGTPCEAGELVGVEAGTGRLYRVDTTTGKATLYVPPLGMDLGGIAYNGHGTLYALAPTGQGTELHTLLSGTTGSTLVGNTGLPAGGPGEGSLSFDPTTGTLVTCVDLTGAGPELVRLDPSTAQATLVGSTGLGQASTPCGLGALSNGDLLALDPRGPAPDALVVLDAATGRATRIGPTGTAVGAGGVGGLAVDPASNRVYLSDGFTLYTVNLRTGRAAPLGSHGTGSPLSGISVQSCPCLVGIEWDTSDSVLWNVDPTNGVTSVPRPTGLGGFGALAQGPGDELYAIRHLAEALLYEIDQATGAPTLIGPMGMPVIEGGLDFDPTTGILYGVNGKPPGQLGGLFTVDTTTGVATYIAPILEEDGTGTEVSAMAFDAAGNLFVLKSLPGPLEIWRLDPSDASVLARVPIPGLAVGGAGVAGMEFDDTTGTCYVSHGNSSPRLAEVDPVAGTFTELGYTPADAALEIVRSCRPTIAKPPVHPAPPPFTKPNVVNWARGKK